MADNRVPRFSVLLRSLIISPVNVVEAYSKDPETSIIAPVSTLLGAIVVKAQEAPEEVSRVPDYGESLSVIIPPLFEQLDHFILFVLKVARLADLFYSLFAALVRL